MVVHFHVSEPKGYELTGTHGGSGHVAHPLRFQQRSMARTATLFPPVLNCSTLGDLLGILGIHSSIQSRRFAHILGLLATSVSKVVGVGARGV